MRTGRLADPARAPGRAFVAVLFLALVGAMAAIVYGALRFLPIHRPDRAVRVDGPSEEGEALTSGRPVTLPPPSLAERERPSATLHRAMEPPPADPPAPNQPSAQAIAPAAAAAPPPAAKRSDVSMAALAAERSRIALAELTPRHDRLVQSGPPAPGAPPGWSVSADALRDELGRSLIVNTGVRVSGSTCFRGGCLFTVDAANEAADVEARGRLKMLLRGELPRPFPGEGFVSGVVARPDGYLRTTVILSAPEGGDVAK
jgi:hypothetical protein